MDGVAGVSASSCWRSVVACWGACRYNMGNVSAHEAQYAGAAVMVAEVSPRPPRWSGRCARATAVAGILAASRRVAAREGVPGFRPKRLLQEVPSWAAGRPQGSRLGFCHC